VSSPVSSATPLSSPRPSQGTSTGRGTEFVPVPGGEPESTSATVMVVVAYTLLWALVLGFVVRIWKNQRSTDRRISHLERQLPDPPSST
jgi:hypothetical protein